MSKNIIYIEKLSKNFTNNKMVVRVLKNLNLKLEVGKIIALVGPSGSGKSTFLDLVTGFISPNTGKILLKSVF